MYIEAGREPGGGIGLFITQVPKVLKQRFLIRWPNFGVFYTYIGYFCVLSLGMYIILSAPLSYHK